MHEVEFRDQTTKLGCTKFHDVVLTADRKSRMHAHDYDAHVLVMDGRMSLVTTDGERALSVGEVCTVPAGTLHSERAASETTRILVAEIPTTTA